jgi:hypothetical protein
MLGWFRNDEMEMMCKDVVVAHCKIISINLPGGTEGKNQNTQPLIRDLNPVLPK